MNKRIFCLFLLCASVMLFTSPVWAVDYQIAWAGLQTRPLEGGSLTTYIWFAVVDADIGQYADTNVVKSAQLVVPQGTGTTTIDLSVRWEGWYHRNRLKMDDNDGNNKIEGNELYTSPLIENEYEIILPAEYTPHPEGNYTLIVTFIDDSVRQFDLNGGQAYEAGKDASTMPPLQNINAAMDQTGGALTISWTLPTNYEDGSVIFLRLDTYRNGMPIFLRWELDKWNKDNTQFIFTSRLRNLFASMGINQFRIQVRIYSPDRSSCAVTSYYDYKFNADTNTVSSTAIRTKTPVAVIPLGME